MSLKRASTIQPLFEAVEHPTCSHGGCDRSCPSTEEGPPIAHEPPDDRNGWLVVGMVPTGDGRVVIYWERKAGVKA